MSIQRHFYYKPEGEQKKNLSRRIAEKKARLAISGKRIWLALAATLIFASALVLCGSGTAAHASQATSYTYTMDEKGNLTRTQDAYLPDQTITDLGLNNPSDLFVDDDNMLYIADSGNGRVVKYSIGSGKIAGILTHEEMTNPRGIYVTKAGDIYVADPSAKKVFCFDRNFNYLESFGKPDSPNFSDTPYEPHKVAVNNGENIYIIGKGVYAGVIQLSYGGEFLGYFTVNKTRLSFIQAIQNAIFTRAQLENLVDRVPPTFSNIFIDHNGIVYTTTMGDNRDGLKKHDTAGRNMFKKPVWGGYGSMTDVYVDEYGIIYTSSHDGYVEVYSGAGEFIFEFGSYVLDLDVSGLFSNLPAIAVDRNRTIWTVDGDKGYLQSFKPTDYALMVYNAIGLYEKGLYEKAMEQWNEVLRLNQMSVLAHNGVGKAYLHAQKYEDAMEHFKVSGDRDYYSQAFWEVRNRWLQDHLPGIAAVIAAIWLASFLIKYFDKKGKIRRLRKKIADRVSNVAVLKDVFYAFRIPKHPLDRYYDIRVGKSGSVIGATILYGLFFLIYMLYLTGKGFIYQKTAVEDMDINAIVLGFFTILGLFVICNYLVTSIKDGDGDFKQVYMTPAYGLVPVMVSMTVVTVASYGLTYNEAFLLTVTLWIGIVWSVVNVFVGFMTIHDYTVRENMASLILTVVFMMIAAIIALIIIIMWDRLYGFLQTLVKEMTRNVFG